MTKLLIGTILIWGIYFKTSLPTIDIISVDKNIESIVRIECSHFVDAFEEDEKEIRRIKAEKEVGDLLSELKNLQTFDDRTATDARAQIVIKYSDHVDIICADKFSIYQNGKCYRITDHLRKKIWK